MPTMIKICEGSDGALSILAIHKMLKAAQRHNLGAYVRVYTLDALGNRAEVWHQGDMRRPVTSFPEWGIEFENGIVCSIRSDAPPPFPAGTESGFLLPSTDHPPRSSGSLTLREPFCVASQRSSSDE